MARSADPLQSAGHRRWSLDLHHDVDGTHIDPELQRRCGDNAWQPTCLEVVLDLSALFLADRAVVRSSDDGPRLPSRPLDAPDCAITCAGGGNGPATRRGAPCRSLRWAVSRSASRRELAKTMLERCSLIRSRNSILDMRPD